MIDAPEAIEMALPGDEERRLLRDSVRGFLAQAWPVAGAVERGADPAALRRIWRQLAGQGIAALGAERTEAACANWWSSCRSSAARRARRR